MSVKDDNKKGVKVVRFPETDTSKVAVEIAEAVVKRQELRHLVRMSQSEAMVTYIRNPRFRRVMFGDKYVFVNGNFVVKQIGVFLLETGISLEDFISLYGKNLGITSVFDIALHYYRYPHYGHTRGRPSFSGKVAHGHRRLSNSPRALKSFEDASRVEDINLMSKNAFMKCIGFGGDDNNENNGSSGNEPPNKFKELLDGHLDDKDITIEGLAELTGISDRTIRRMRNNVDYKKNLGYVVAICIALHLTPKKSEKLVQEAGLSFKTTPEDQAYLHLIDCAYNKTVVECNTFLKRMGLEPLTPLQYEEVD